MIVLAVRVLGCVLGAAALAACAARTGAAAAPRAPDAESERARVLAPDLYGRAQAAQGEAAAASTAEERALALERAELWLRAARTEARRIEQQQAASAAESRAAAADARRAAAALELARLSRAAADAERARAARAEAQRMWTGAGLLGAERVEGGPEALGRAAQFAVDRAQLQVAAARALGLPPAAADALEARIAALAGPARAEAPTRAQLRDVLALLHESERVLGQVRLARPELGDAERTTLAADAEERGLSLRFDARGASIALPAACFSPGGTQLTEQGDALLAALASLLRLHARGPAQVVAPAGRVPARSARTLTAALERAGQRGRVQLAAGQAAELGVVLPGYARIVEPK